jgi:hypothetical protein
MPFFSQPSFCSRQYNQMGWLTDACKPSHDLYIIVTTQV